MLSKKLPQGTHSDPQYRFHNVLFLCVATAWVLSAPYVCGCPVRPEEGVGVEGSCELWELNEPWFYARAASSSLNHLSSYLASPTPIPSSRPLGIHWVRDLTEQEWDRTGKNLLESTQASTPLFCFLLSWESLPRFQPSFLLQDLTESLTTHTLSKAGVTFDPLYHTRKTWTQLAFYTLLLKSLAQFPMILVWKFCHAGISLSYFGVWFGLVWFIYNDEAETSSLVGSHSASKLHLYLFQL